jgi:hypothetical protein
MKRYSTFVCGLVCIFFTINSYAQESLLPIGQKFTNTSTSNLKTGAINNTFYYSFDTLQLPFLDDFSKDNFSVRDAQVGDPNVTPIEYFKMKDFANVPYPVSVKFSSIPTIIKTVTGTATVESFNPTISIQLTDLTAYPVVYNTTSVYPPYTLIDTTDFANPIDTIWLSNPDIVQDSATIYEVIVSDPSKLWEDNFVDHNYTRASNPWTLGIATFDGLDENGFPYAINTTTSGAADVLTSKHIDLSSFSPGDSIYMTFVVQPEGLGDEPESTDSIVLEFYNSISDDWQQVWGMKGSDLTDFKVGHVRIKDAPYLTNGFQFRFKNFGGLSGMLDEFHLDYVYIRLGSVYYDTLLEDFAFVYPIGSLIDTYTQVPWDHWKNDPTHMKANVEVTVKNNSNTMENNQNGSITIFDGPTNEGSFTLVAQTLSGGLPNYGPRTFYSSEHDCSTGYVFDDSPIEDEKAFTVIGVATAPFSNLQMNDSSITQQVFKDVYAYDDGSAEAAYGLTAAQARLAMRFVPYEADTLLGVQFHFVPTVNDVSDKLFLLTVWADNAGQPGSVLYEDEFFYPRTPVYTGEQNGFFTYFFDDSSLFVPDAPYYVGFRQIDSDRLNVGFDRNNDNKSQVRYSLNGGLTWATSTISGTPMIRPMYSTQSNFDLSVRETREIVDYSVYPNPTSGIVNIKWNSTQEYKGAEIYSLLGQHLYSLNENEYQVNLSDLPSGIYMIVPNGYESAVQRIVR